MRSHRFPLKSLVLAAIGIVVVTLVGHEPRQSVSFAATETKENISINVDGLIETIPASTAATVGELFDALHISLSDQDELWPKAETPLASGQHITLRHQKTLILQTTEGRREVRTTLPTADKMLAENGIPIGENDLVLPSETAPLKDGDTLKIIRVTIEEKPVNEPISFTKQVREDPTLSWRKTIVEQKGVQGIKTLTYRIKTHDGKMVEKKLINTEITREPVTEITTQGTYVAVGKSHTGLGTWYAHTGTLAAASPWLPLGSYARVTNKENGKSVIVKINDRGPFGPNRIIDLDKVAFQKIASIGAGIINVKVEEIIN